MATDGPRRSVEAVPNALLMDRRRRELYVEGPSDRMFVLFLAGEARDENVVVQDIGATTDTRSDSKRALVTFAKSVAGFDRILCFADADHDRLRGVVHTINLVLTDPRDLEGYFLRVECLEKVIRLGTHTEKLNPGALLDEVLAAARSIGVLRLASDVEGYGLPFSRIRPSTASESRKNSLTFNFDKYVTALLDRSIGRRRRNEVMAAYVSTQARTKDFEDQELVHGKDALDLVTVVLRQCGVSKSDAPKLVWTSFERGLAKDYPNLMSIVRFVSSPTAA